MDQRRGPAAVAALGVGLLAAAVVHHAAEVAAVEGMGGPVVALALDGGLALGVVYAGYRLAGTDLTAAERWRVARFTGAGTVVGVGAIWATLAVRRLEGREIAELAFPLLVVAGAGALAGVVAGYYAARSAAATREAETATSAFAFVNDLIRHDLRNDLAAIRGYAEMVADAEAAGDAPDPGAVIERKAEEGLTRIETTDGVATTLLGDPDLEAVDLARIVRDATERLRGTTAATVEADLPDRAFVVANAGLRSVVDNLLENAVEHAGDDPRVRVAVEGDAERVELVVEDDGPGVPPEEREALFEARGDGGGGLYLVATLVEGYGGDVAVGESSLGGAEFAVTLPADGDGRG